MILSINQPAYLPWLGYFDRLIKSDLHVILDHVQFEKNSMLNRNKIYSSNGPCLLTVPLNTKNNFGSLEINKLQISQQNKWQKKHWQSIFFNYKKAAFFKRYSEELEYIYKKSWYYLAHLLKEQLSFFLRALKINTNIIYSSDLQLKESKSDLILEICKNLDVDCYISGPFGRDYLELNKFTHNNIKVYFHDYKHPCYKQFSDEFISHLSVLDVLMHYGDAAIDIIVEQDYEN